MSKNKFIFFVMQECLQVLWLIKMMEVVEKNIKCL